MLSASRELPSWSGIAFVRSLGSFRRQFILLTIVAFVSAALRFGGVFILGELVTALPQVDPSEVLLFYIPLWIGSLIVVECLDYLTRRFAESLPEKVADLAYQDLLLSLFDAPLSKLRIVSLEKLHASLKVYRSHIERFGHEWSWTLVHRAVNFLTILVLLGIQGPLILLLAILYLTTFLFISFSISSAIAPYAARHSIARLRVDERQLESALALPFLRRMRGVTYVEEILQSLYGQAWGALDSLKSFHAWRWLLQLNIYHVLSVGCIGFGAYQVALGRLELGFLVLLRWAFDQLWNILVFLVEWYVRLLHERQDRLILQQQISHILPLSQSLTEVGENKTQDRAFSCFEYKEGSVQIATDLVLRFPSFEIRQGERIGVIGESGSGKTSFLEVLSGLTPGGGMFRVDGASNPEKIECIQDGMVICTPHDPLFKVSLRENLSLGKQIDDETIWQVIRGVQAQSFVSSLDQTVGEDNIGFSSGECQRLRLARALLAESDFLLLDEPLTGIDQENRAKIQSFLTTYLKGTTVIWVTHSTDELAFLDRYYVFERLDLRRDEVETGSST